MDTPPALRYLGSVPTISGSAGLEGISTYELVDGACCYVVSSQAMYFLHKSSAADADGVAVVAPAAGSGRWLLQPSSAEQAPSVKLWVPDNASSNVVGYFESRTTADYDGEPDVVLTLPSDGAVCHELCVLENGDLLVTTSETGSGPESASNPELLWYIPARYTLASRVLTENEVVKTPIMLPECAATGYASASVGSRMCSSLAGGQLLVCGRNGPLMRLERSYAMGRTGRLVHMDMQEVSPGSLIIGGPWCADVDRFGNYWVATGAGADASASLIRLPLADLLAADGTADNPYNGTLVNADKWFQGADVGKAWLMCFGPDYSTSPATPGGALYYGGGASNASDEIRRFTEVALLAGSGVLSNPTVDATFTSAHFANAFLMAFDLDDNLWVSTVDGSNTLLVRYPAASLVTGGAVEPDVTITMPPEILGSGVWLGVGHTRLLR